MASPVSFTLQSTELRDYRTVHNCTVIGVLRGSGPDKLRVRVEPPIPGYLYDEPGDINEVVLAPRHVGLRLVPEVSEWPCHVHICLPVAGGNWDKGPFRSA